MQGLIRIDLSHNQVRTINEQQCRQLPNIENRTLNPLRLSEPFGSLHVCVHTPGPVPLDFTLPSIPATAAVIDSDRI